MSQPTSSDPMFNCRGEPRALRSGRLVLADDSRTGILGRSSFFSDLAARQLTWQLLPDGEFETDTARKGQRPPHSWQQSAVPITAYPRLETEFSVSWHEQKSKAICGFADTVIEAQHREV